MILCIYESPELIRVLGGGVCSRLIPPRFVLPYGDITKSFIPLALAYNCYHNAVKTTLYLYSGVWHLNKGWIHKRISNSYVWLFYSMLLWKEVLKSLHSLHIRFHEKGKKNTVQKCSRTVLLESPTFVKDNFMKILLYFTKLDRNSWTGIIF